MAKKKESPKSPDELWEAAADLSDLNRVREGSAPQKEIEEVLFLPNPTVFNEFLARRRSDPGEVHDKPSKTVPGMDMTVPEILSRFTRGMEIPTSGLPIYDGHLNLKDPRTMDKTERAQYAMDISKVIGRVKEDIEKQEEAARNAEINDLQTQIRSLENQLANPPASPPKG